MKIAKLELEKEQAWNDTIIEYLKNHTRQSDGVSYYDSFTQTIEYAQAKGLVYSNTIDPEKEEAALEKEMPAKKPTRTRAKKTADTAE